MSLHITLLRHGKADKTLPDHRLHPLSEVGIAQAVNRRTKLDEPKYDLVLHSHLLRARQTALTVAGLDEGNETLEIKSLFPEDSDPRMAAVNELFDKLGYAPLSAYEAQARGSLDSIALEMKSDVWNAIARAFFRHDRIQNVLLVGHAVLLPALCQALTGQAAPFAADLLGECEGYELWATDLNTAGFVRSLK